MFCPNCGKQIPDNSRFCPVCGQPSQAGAPGPGPEFGPQVPPPPPPAYPPVGPQAGAPPPRQDIPVFKNDPVIVLLLGFVTCGLYLIYWNIKTAQVMNAVSGTETISPLVAIISGCCMPVNIYFYYLCGQSLEDLGRFIGKDLKDQKVLLMILAFLVPMVAAMIVQGHMNRLYDQQ